MENIKYIAHIPDKNGYINYSNEENITWGLLYNRQIAIVKERACQEYFDGLDKLDFSQQTIPQTIDVSEKLRTITGWTVEPVSTLIGFNAFFQMLSQRRFPAASFIRRREELDFLADPDIFHELFGHCPMLTEPTFAAFVKEIGDFGITLDHSNQVLLGRLFWFTVECGLIKKADELQIYGASIISSKDESIYAVESSIPQRELFDLVTVLRMPYRYDQIQKIYFIISGYEELYNIIAGDKLLKAFNQVKNLGFLKQIDVS